MNIGENLQVAKLSFEVEEEVLNIWKLRFWGEEEGLHHELVGWQWINETRVLLFPWRERRENYESKRRVMELWRNGYVFFSPIFFYSVHAFIILGIFFFFLMSSCFLLFQWIRSVPHLYITDYFFYGIPSPFQMNILGVWQILYVILYKLNKKVKVYKNLKKLWYITIIIFHPYLKIYGDHNIRIKIDFNWID